MTVHTDLVSNGLSLYQLARGIYFTEQISTPTPVLISIKNKLIWDIASCQLEGVRQAYTKDTNKLYSEKQLNEIFKILQLATSYLEGKEPTHIPNEKEHTALSSLTKFIKLFERSIQASRSIFPSSISQKTTSLNFSASIRPQPRPPSIVCPLSQLGFLEFSSSPTKPSSEFITYVAVLLSEDKTLTEKARAIDILLQNLEKDCLDRVYHSLFEQSKDSQKKNDLDWIKMHVADSASLLLTVLMDELPARLPTVYNQPKSASTVILNETQSFETPSSEIFVEAAKYLLDTTSDPVQKAQEINELLEGVSKEIAEEIYSEILALSNDPSKGSDVQWVKKNIAQDPRLLLDVLIEKLPYNASCPSSPSLPQTEEDSSSSLSFPSGLIDLTTSIGTCLASSEMQTSDKADRINLLLQKVSAQMRETIYAELFLQSEDISKSQDPKWAHEHIADNAPLLLNILLSLPPDRAI